MSTPPAVSLTPSTYTQTTQRRTSMNGDQAKERRHRKDMEDQHQRVEDPRYIHRKKKKGPIIEGTNIDRKLTRRKQQRRPKQESA